MSDSSSSQINITLNPRTDEEAESENNNSNGNTNSGTSESVVNISQNNPVTSVQPPSDSSQSPPVMEERSEPGPSRRQRNGLFGINLDLNFDPSSWLSSSNAAGRSISSLSVLPEWVRQPTNNRSNGGEGHESFVSGAASRLLSHYHRPPSTGTGSGLLPTMQQNAGGTRTRSNLPAMRSVEEDMSEELGATGRNDSNSYVIDMDTPPIGAWTEYVEGPSTSHSRSGERIPSRSDGQNLLSRASNSDGDNSGEERSNSGGERAGLTRSQSGLGSPSGGDNREGRGSGDEDGDTPNSGADTNGTGNDRARAAEILRDAPETRAFLNEISRYTTIRPFIVICFLKGVFDHGTSILALLALVVTFSHANSMVKKEVSKQKKRNLLYLSMIVINLAACVAFIYYVFMDMGLHFALAFLPTTYEVNTFWGLVWVVAVTDYVAKFGTVFVKILVVSMPACVVPFQKRGKHYLFIEHTSQLYRSFIPVHPWLFYLVSAYEGTASMFGLFLAGLYIFFKVTDSIGRFKEWLKALEKLLSNVHYGTTPTPKQLDTAGNICPICHDGYTSPTRLACAHIFCEECVSTWFDRERTCPMCRAKVVDDPTYRDGSTSQYIQLF